MARITKGSALAAVWQRAFHGFPNIMTPDLVSFASYPVGSVQRLIEISHGTGIVTPHIYGVTVLDYDPATDTTTRRDDLSQMRDSLDAAKAYRDEVKTAD